MKIVIISVLDRFVTANTVRVNCCLPQFLIMASLQGLYFLEGCLIPANGMILAVLSCLIIRPAKYLYMLE